MDIETSSFFEYIINTYVIRVVCAVGIVGNIAILVILSRRGAKETAFVYIRALAAVDMIVCVSLLGVGTVRCGECRHLSPTARYWGRIYEGFIYLPIANTFQMANLFITMTMAIHRVVSVIQIRKASHDGYALRINVRRSRKLARRLVIVIIIISTAINAMRFFFYTVEEVKRPAVVMMTKNSDETADQRPKLPLQPLPLKVVELSKNGDRFISRELVVENPSGSLSPLSHPIWTNCIHFADSNSTIHPRDWPVDAGFNEPDTNYVLNKTKFHDTVSRSFMYALSAVHFAELVILTTVNLILIRILRQSKLQRKNILREEIQLCTIQQRKRRDGDDVTRMLVVTVLVHIFCHLHSPFSAPPIADLVFGKNYTESHVYRVQLAGQNTFTLTSHAITFFLYLVSRKFRKQASRTWDCCLHHFGRTKRQLTSPTPNHSWTPSYLKGGASPILPRNQSSVTMRFL